MQFLRILLLPLLSILLVTGNQALGNLYSYPLGVSSVVKNNAKTDVGMEMGMTRLSFRDPGGVFVSTKENIKGGAAAYQKFVTGNEATRSYLLKGVKFDGYKNGVLIEAKGKYSQFLKGEKFADWFQKTGQKELLKQADRQVRAAGGMPIEWHFLEKEVAEVMRKLFVKKSIKIKVIHTPLPS